MEKAYLVVKQVRKVMGLILQDRQTANVFNTFLSLSIMPKFTIKSKLLTQYYPLSSSLEKLDLFGLS